MSTRAWLRLCLCLLAASAAQAAPRTPPKSPAADERVSLPALAERYGLAFAVTGRTVTLRHSLATLTLEADSRQMRFNGTLIWLNDGARLNGRHWSVSEGDASAVFAPLLDAQVAPPLKPPVTIVIDPGHGGEDAGAKGTARMPFEKELNLAIALLVAERLKGTGNTVMLTREKDVDLVLQSRPRAAERVRADVFVSIHLNWATNRTVAGVETYLLPATGFISTMGRARDTDRAPGNRFDAANQLLAYDVHRAVIAKTEAIDRGVRRARFDVLSLAPCPAILVECGFLSNAKEADAVVTPEYRAKIADGVAQGIQTYLYRCEAQARRREPQLPAPPPPAAASTNAVSVPGTVQTDRTDRAVQAPPPGDTAR